MRALSLKILRRLWAGLAVLLVCGAVVVVLTRVMLPRLDQYRPAVESWAGAFVGKPVRLGALHATWRGGLPSIAAQDISVPGTDGASPILQFARAQADLAPLASLLAGEIVLTRLVLSGVELTLVRDADGNIAIAGLPATDPAFRTWLLGQRDFTIANADVTFIDLRAKAPTQVFADISLAVSASPQGPRIRGAIADGSALGGRLDFELVLAATPAVTGWNAELRLAGERIVVAGVAQHLGWPALAETVGAADGRLWLRWRDGLLARVAFDLTGHELGWDDPGAYRPAQLRVAGLAARTQDAWRVKLDELAFGPSAGSPRDIDLRAEYTLQPAARRLRLSATQLPLDGLLLFSPQLPAGLGKFGEFARATAASGELDGLRLGYSDGPDAEPAFYLAADLHHLALHATAELPELDGAEATLAINRSGGAAGFRDAAFTVTAADRLVAPLTVAGLNGVLAWTLDAQGAHYRSRGLAAAIAGIPVALTGMATLAEGARPRVDLELTAGPGDVSRVHHFMPIGVMSPAGEHWLREAFRSGRLESAALVLQGALDEFPFDEGQGLFTAAFTLRDTELRYSEKWPLATGVDGKVALAGRKLGGEISAGKFYSSPIKQVKLALADIFSKRPVLLVNGTARATLADAQRVVRESPLAQGAAMQIADLAVTGEFDLALDLNLGLKQGAERTVLGQVEFAGNRVRSKRENITLEDVHGRVSFTREDWYGEGLTAVYDGQRVGLVVNGGVGDPNYDSEFRMTGTADASQLVKYIEKYIPYLHRWLSQNGKLSALTGELPWKAVLTIPHARADGNPVAKQLVIESSLHGLDIALPWPFGKISAEQKPLRIETLVGATEEHTTRVAFGDVVRLEMRQRRAADRVTRITGADVAFGAGENAAPVQDGIYLHGKIDTLPLNEWAVLLKDAAQPRVAASALPLSFDLKIATLRTLGQSFADVEMHGYRDPDAWRITMQSARAAGAITVPNELGTAPLTLNFERLWLEKVESAGKTGAIDPRRMPAFVLACSSFKYGSIDLGQAALATERIADGQRLQSLLFRNAAFQLQATGTWLISGDHHQSQFNIQLEGESIGEVLQTFGYDAAAMKGGRTQIDVEAAWLGTPADFTLARLDGKLQLRVNKGRFLDIEPGGGRLFGLMSLQMLPRRLSLDFADLFQKGFAYDRIEGWFELERGNAYTNSLMMEGPSARVEVSGRTGLAEHDYDQRAIVTPALSQSIPLASALFGPAGIGVGAAIYLGQKMFKGIPEQVDRFLRRQYSITGSWDKPVVEKL